MDGAVVSIGKAKFPSPFTAGLEYSAPARGTWNIVHTGMLIPQAHQIFVCAASCLRGVVLTAAEMNAQDRFSTIEIRENNVLNGDMEELIINGVSDILLKLPAMPPAVLIYTSCIHHFIGCDLPLVYKTLREKFPGTDFTDCYMNPIMRKSGLNPDQLMRRQLYSLLKKRDVDERCISIVGNDLATDKSSELVQLILSGGFTLREIQSCRSYEEYQKMAESALFVSYYPAAAAGGEALAKRLGRKHLFLPFTLDCKKIEENFSLLAKELCIGIPDYSEKKVQCEAALKEAREIIKDAPVTIDYTALPVPLGLARLLLCHGFNVTRVYADSFQGTEKDDFDYLAAHFPSLELVATVHARMRFARCSQGEKTLAIGQKAAYFSGTNNFVNIVEGGGMYGFEAIVRLSELMVDAFLREKDTRSLIQIKGMGCGCCV